MSQKFGQQPWRICEEGFHPNKVEIHGSKFLIGNGYMGYRGTLEEFGASQLVACTLSGLYDRHGDAWREPVNAPNGLFVKAFVGSQELNPLLLKPLSHVQELDLRHGIHRRETRYRLKGGLEITIRAERFASMDTVHLLGLRYSIESNQNVKIRLQSGVDYKVWDINGPHLKSVVSRESKGLIEINALSNEGKRLALCECSEGLIAKPRLVRRPGALLREWQLPLKAHDRHSFVKFVSVYSSVDSKEPLKEAGRLCNSVRQIGFDLALGKSQRRWEGLWADSDVRIGGDPEAQLSLRYSIYHLLSIAPSHSDRTSIPARGLSGQVYKGAIFWDTEMFMLPFFSYTQPALARNLVQYRYHTLPGARKKAKSLGFRGAFYAWESQESGEEACTLFNITDILTNRPLRTYFADKQVHISADVAHGVWLYFRLSGDDSVLLEGGAEVILECARFFMSYAYFKSEKGRYEILDVTGPDEYHERVHNNAFSSAMAKEVARMALDCLALLRKKYPSRYRSLIQKLGFQKELEALKDFEARLYVPAPDAKSGVIEQFDGYYKLEDVSLKELKGRLLNPKEYLGGGQGLATTTRIIKQADVMTLLHVLGQHYSKAVKKANWEFYEPRTEHGSSLSPCIYALVAAAIGNTEWAYRYFMKTATVDLSGDSKQYVGTLYIGGTHPAANGGAWMAAVLGFGGLSQDGQGIRLEPRLPKAWRSLSFKVKHLGQSLELRIESKALLAFAPRENEGSFVFRVGAKTILLAPGESRQILLSRN